jgi:ATP-binding cassette subfamily A (ABC1) protein 3
VVPDTFGISKPLCFCFRRSRGEQDKRDAYYRGLNTETMDIETS